MVDIQSKEVIDKISDELKIQPSMQIPRVLGKEIQLTYNVNPVKNNRTLISINRTTTASSATVFTVDSVRRTFITGMTMANISDVSADNTSIVLAATSILGNLFALFQWNKITLTVLDRVSSISFNEPIELLPGSVISLTNAFAAGISLTNIILYGYTTDPE